jgi:hypothetical protein
MNYARTEHSATLLKDGKVLVAGGTGEPGAITSKTAEIYDPSIPKFLPVKQTMTVGRARHAAVLEPDSTVLIACGESDEGSSPLTPSADIFSPGTGAFERTMNEVPFGEPFGRAAPTTPCLAFSLSHGKSIVIGANVGTVASDRALRGIPASLYEPRQKRFIPRPAIPLGTQP